MWKSIFKAPCVSHPLLKTAQVVQLPRGLTRTLQVLVHSGRVRAGWKDRTQRFSKSSHLSSLVQNLAIASCPLWKNYWDNWSLSMLLSRLSGESSQKDHVTTSKKCFTWSLIGLHCINWEGLTLNKCQHSLIRHYIGTTIIQFIMDEIKTVKLNI